jgi:S1-C subfamily serine protease
LAIALLISLLGSAAFAQQDATPKGDFGANFITVTPEIAKARGLVFPETAKVPLGVVVTEMTPNGAAANANIEVNDVIETINDHRVERADDAHAVLDCLAPGSQVRLTVMRRVLMLYAEGTVLVTLNAP